jgi:hypothetical protein
VDSTNSARSVRGSNQWQSFRHAAGRPAVTLVTMSNYLFDPYPDDLPDPYPGGPYTDEPPTPLLSLLMIDFGRLTVNPMPLDLTPVVDPLGVIPDLDLGNFGLDS